MANYLGSAGREPIVVEDEPYLSDRTKLSLIILFSFIIATAIIAGVIITYQVWGLNVIPGQQIDLLRHSRQFNLTPFQRYNATSKLAIEQDNRPIILGLSDYPTPEKRDYSVSMWVYVPGESRAIGSNTNALLMRLTDAKHSECSVTITKNDYSNRAFFNTVKDAAVTIRGNNPNNKDAPADETSSLTIYLKGDKLYVQCRLDLVDVSWQDTPNGRSRGVFQPRYISDGSLFTTLVSSDRMSLNAWNHIVFNAGQTELSLIVNGSLSSQRTLTDNINKETRLLLPSVHWVRALVIGGGMDPRSKYYSTSITNNVVVTQPAYLDRELTRSDVIILAENGESLGAPVLDTPPALGNIGYVK